MYGIYENGQVIARFTAPLTVRSNQPVFVSDTLSLKRQITRQSAQRWEIEAGLEPLSTSANDLFVNLVTNGYTQTVSIIVPQNYSAKSKRTANNNSVIATGSAGSSQVTIEDSSGLIPKGTFIKFANHSKIYITTSNLIGEGNLNIFPNLLVNLTDIALSYKDDVTMSCLYDTDVVRGMVYSDGILMDLGTIRLVEKL